MSHSEHNSFFADKAVVLTGANRGIGLALAQALHAANARVFAGCREPKAASELNEQATASHGKLRVCALDVSSDASVARFTEQLPKAIDVLINNAGVNLDQGEVPKAIAPAKLRDTFEVNTLGPLRMMQALHNHLLAAKGRVANISSIMGSIADNGSGGNTAYRVSKTALNMLTKNFALASEDIVYLAMHPGWLQTDMGGPRAPVTTDESARGLLARIAAASHAQSGTFVRFDGQGAPW